jgi:hypothetical protein
MCFYVRFVVAETGISGSLRKKDAVRKDIIELFKIALKK